MVAAMRQRHFGILLCIALVSAHGQSTERGDPIQITGPTMGTTYLVKIARPPSGVEAEAVREGVERVLDHVNTSMSTYREDSELSMLNRNTATGWISASLGLVQVIQEALRVSRLTNGAFDVTVGPLVNLWGFGPNGRTERAPTQAQIEAAMKKVGYDRIDARLSPPAIHKDSTQISIDLSAIAKGYAIDKVSNHLESLGVHDYLVEIGGDLKVKGHNQENTPWRIAIEQPLPGHRSVHRVIELTDRAMATSGDYRNYFEHDGRRYSHTIDPRQGTPISHNLASVTVVSPKAMHADAMATALMVLGPVEGYALAEQHELEVYFLTRNGDTLNPTHTPAFDRHLVR